MGINTCYPYVHRVRLHTDISLPTYRDKRETGLLIAEYLVHVHIPFTSTVNIYLENVSCM
jgi:hypothetical protein